MLNMIKLDWLGMKCYHKRILFILPLISFYGLLHEAILIPTIGFIMLSFSVNPFAVEEKGKLDNLYLTLPVTRKNIVKARFGLSLILQFIGLVFGTTVTILLSNLLYGKTIFDTHTFKADFNIILMLICFSLLFYAIMNLSMFPILFKIGYAKGKAIGFYIPITAVGVLVTTVYLLFYFSGAFQTWMISALDWAFANTVWTSFLLLAMAAFVLAISYFLSRKLYAKRDL